MVIFAFSFQNSKSDEIVSYLCGDFYFYDVLLSAVIINIATYNQHASKLDGTMAYIMLKKKKKTKNSPERNVAILNTIHLSLR